MAKKKEATTLSAKARSTAEKAGLPILICQKCGSEFVPDKLHPYQKYGPCCRKPTRKAVPEARKCEYCGESFIPDKAHPYQRFCTPAHAAAARKAGKTATKAPRRPKTAPAKGKKKATKAKIKAKAKASRSRSKKKPKS